MTPPDTVPDDLPKAKSAKQVLDGIGGGGNPLGNIGGDPIGTCLFNCDESIRIKDPVRTPKRPPPEVDFSALTCRVCPDPPQKELQLTSAAVMGKKGVSNRTRFCVESSGRVSSVVTSKRSGDADVDRIVKASVRQWRFAPMVVDGRPRKTCSTASFDIRFE